MTTLSPRTVSPIGSATDAGARFARRIALARASLAVEHIVPALWPALGFAGLYLSIALFGLFAFVPWTLQALALAATITAIGISVDAGLGDFAWPGWRDGARRLEENNGLKHRPISTSRDRLISEDPFALELWRMHQARSLGVDGLRVGWPAPNLGRRDPKYLRYAVLVLVAAALVVSGPNWRKRLIQAFDSGASLTVTLAAWVDQPPAIGGQPIYLGPRDTDVITVPAGSILELRAYNAAHAPGLVMGWPLSSFMVPRFIGDGGRYADSVRIVSDTQARVRFGGHVIGNWRLHVLPDQPPTIVFENIPTTVEHLGTRIAFHANDDYGVEGVKLVMTPHPRSNAPPNQKLVPVAVDMQAIAGRSVEQTTFIDLTNHPYAGLVVDAHLEARDGGGQIGKSKIVTFAMPAPPPPNTGSKGQSKQAQDKSKGQKKDADPLGRIKIPDGNDQARSRAIMNVLRERAGQRDRPQQELDYYARLLKQF